MGRYATVGGNLQVLEDLNFPSDSYLDSMSDVVCTHKVVKYVALLGLSVTRILLGGGVSVFGYGYAPNKYVSSRILKKRICIGLYTCIRYFWARWDIAQSSNQPTQILFW